MDDRLLKAVPANEFEEEEYYSLREWFVSTCAEIRKAYAEFLRPITFIWEFLPDEVQVAITAIIGIVLVLFVEIFVGYH